MLKPIPGVDDSGSFYHVEPKADTGTYPGMSWAEYRDLKPRLQSIEELVAFRMAPLNVGEAGRTERTYAQLVSGNFFTALRLAPGGRTLHPRRRSRASRRRARRGAVARLLADAFRRIAVGHRPDHSRQRQPADDRRRRARGFPGHDPRAAIRSLGAGDAGAGAVCRIDRARGAQSARLLGDWAACATARTKPARRRSSSSAMRELAALVPGEQRPHQRRADAVLAVRRAGRK